MAKVRKYTYGSNSWTPDASLGKAFFDSFNCPLIETTLVDSETFTVNIDNTVLLSFNGSSAVRNITATIDGVTTEIGSGQTYQTYGSKTFIVTCSSSFIYIDFLLTYTGKRLNVLYEKIGNLKYFGYLNDNGNIQSFDIKNLGDGLNYKHGKRLNYTCELDVLDYTSDCIFLSDGQKTDVEDTNFVSCTDITAKKVITFNGENYYALGTNILAHLDTNN